MKNLIIIILFGFLIASCKKDYTCHCTDYYTTANHTTYDYSQTVIHDTKKHAQATCKGLVNQGQGQSRECELYY